MKRFGKTFTGTLFHAFDQEIRQDIKRSTKKPKKDKNKNKKIYNIEFPSGHKVIQLFHQILQFRIFHFINL